MLMQIEWLSTLIGPTASHLAELIIVLILTLFALAIITVFMEEIATGRWFKRQ